MKPVRKVVTRSPHRSVGVVHEPWFLHQPIQHESMLEKKCIEMLLLTPFVTKIEFQPLQVEFKVGEKVKHYTPDFRATLSDGTTALLEAKGKPFEAEFREQLDAGLRPALRGLEMPLYLVPSTLIDPARAEQASELRGMARRALPASSIDELVEWVAQQSRPTIRDAEVAGYSIGHIGFAIGRRRLTVGPSFELSPEKGLFLAHNYEHIHLDYWLGYPGRAEDVAA